MATGRISFCLLLLLCCCCTFQTISARKELKFLHVLSANKFYVPDFNQTSSEFQVPKNLSYNYFINNAVDIPNSVKMELFNLGEQLRAKYGDFIGALYSDELIKMQTVGHPVSIMAGELINAGLWPPVDGQIWNNDLAWQPVPFEYIPVEEDALLLGILCPNFEYETLKVIKNHKNLSSTHHELIQYIKQYGNVTVENPLDVLMLRLALDNIKELNQTLPQWANKIYPSLDLDNLTITAYDHLSTTTLQKRLNGGSLLKEFIKDWKNHINGTINKGRKINIYSGDDRNLAGVMKNLNLTIKEIPSAGDALIFELYYEAPQYYVQVNRYSGDIKESFPFKLPGCDMYCPMEKFQEIVADVLPDNELSLCGSMIKDSGKGSATSISVSNVLMSFVSLIMLYLGTKVC